ncbi:hypothetical protein HAX54_018736, partial [Datura stramonium]|nr:hypothetical protein [Datura stramonium]
TKYAPENWIDEAHLLVEFPNIRDKVRELGFGYIFAKLKECNLISMRKFYENWYTSFGERTKVKIRGQVVSFSFKRFNAFLGTLAVDPSEYFIQLENPPYRNIRRTLY